MISELSSYVWPDNDPAVKVDREVCICERVCLDGSRGAAGACSRCIIVARLGQGTLRLSRMRFLDATPPDSGCARQILNVQVPFLFKYIVDELAPTVASDVIVVPITLLVGCSAPPNR